MRFLLTGGAGFIGSHLADALLARGDRVVLFDDLSTGRLRNVEHLLHGSFADRVEFAEGSVKGYPTVSALVERTDVVVHLAASVGVQLVISRPLDALLNKIRGTEIVLDAASRFGRKVLVASTSEIYGKNAAGPLSEDADRILGSPLKARWAYSTSKAVDEILAHEYWRQSALPTIVVRLFNCAGPRQTGVHGMVIPRFVQQALSGRDLTVYGDGTQSRCFCHVLDTVGALVRLLDTPAAVGDVFNVGSQHEISIRGLAELVVDVVGSSSGIVFVPYAEAYEPGFEDMERRLPDIRKIHDATGWEPTRSLRQIVADTVDEVLTEQGTAARV
jgi:UDP-glucose 4-epimerase